MKSTIALTTLLASALLAGGLVFTQTTSAPAQGPSWMGGEKPADGWRARGDRGPGGPGGPGFFRGGGGPGFGAGGPGFGPGGPGGPGGVYGGVGRALEGAGRLLIPFWENEEVVAELGLTEQQIIALAESHEVTRLQLEETQGTVRDAGQALREEMEKDNPDGAAASSLLNEMTAAANEKGQIILAHAVVVKTVLTEEQEDALPDAVRKQGRELRGELQDLRADVRDTLQNGGTLEDVLALIDAAEIPDPMKDRLSEMAERRAEALASGEAPAPAAGKTGRGRFGRAR